MGENVLDSPSSQHCRHSSVYYIRDRSALGTPSSPGRKVVPAAPFLENNNNMASLTSEHPDALSVGIMAQGLAWARSQRDRRQRLFLQHQAEQQLRKIRQAQMEDNKSASNSRSLLDNPTFQTLMHLAGRTPTTEDAVDEIKGDNNSEDGEDYDVSNKISKSGDGYSVELPVDLTRTDEDDAAWIPPVRVEEENDTEPCPFVLSPEEMQQIAVRVLPRGIAYCRWKRLYSLARDGDAFDACLRSIANEKQTLMVVRTSRDAVLGGFADTPWEAHSQAGASYYGGPGACLFRIDPVPVSTSHEGSDVIMECHDGTNRHNENKASAVRPKSNVKCYHWTGANRYIQLCDAKHKMLAFGGGGDDGSFGLCVEQDFQFGSTGACATFENEPLCDQETFEIVDLEIFGFLIGQF